MKRACPKFTRVARAVRATLIAVLATIAPLAYAQNDAEEPTLAEIDRQLKNPLTSLWSLTFQDNVGIKEGESRRKLLN